MNLHAIDKPEGITTHQSNPNDWGIVEFIAHQNHTPLYVVHRLDKETSGVLLVAKDRETAAALTEYFEKRSVEKKYLFLTDQKVNSKTFSHQSYIERDKDTYISKPEKEPNAFTEFTWLWEQNGVSLWEAKPITGKSHQIRLHAQDLGIPVLGDQKHGGTSWTRLALHAQEISMPEKALNFSSQRPWWADPENSLIVRESFKDLGKKTILAQLMNAYEKRERRKLTQLSSYRLSHDESENFSADLYGNQAWINWYRETDPNEDDLNCFQVFFQKLNKSVFIRRMNNRGQDPNSNQAWSLGDVSSEWTAEENNLKYELKTTQGLSAGLFLDQRANRAWVKQNSLGLSVLNLYSYTCGFSLSAAAGKAKEVCTVDVSAKFLDWGKRNFELNGFDPKKFEFWSQDCLLFLKGALKRQRKFDLIIVDPPSFGRSKDSVFRIEKDWTQLLDLCSSVLNSKGRILFSTNYEKWDFEEFENRVKEWAHAQGFSLSTAPVPDLDYELSSLKRLLKSAILQKKS